MTIDDARNEDWSVQLKHDHLQLTEAEDSDESHLREYWYISNGCGPSGCSKAKFPQQALCWSFSSDANARYRYALHLKLHQNHLMSMADALGRAFNYELTETDVGHQTFKEREEQRKWAKDKQSKKNNYEEARTKPPPEWVQTYVKKEQTRPRRSPETAAGSSSGGRQASPDTARSKCGGRQATQHTDQPREKRMHPKAPTEPPTSRDRDARSRSRRSDRRMVMEDAIHHENRRRVRRRRAEDDGDSDIELTYLNKHLVTYRSGKEVTSSRFTRRDEMQKCRDDVAWSNDELKKTFKDLATTMTKIPRILQVMDAALKSFDDLQRRTSD